jgi:AcrR family transcriptional regulator
LSKINHGPSDHGPAQQQRKFTLAATRRRRSAEEAKAVILDAAEVRLGRYGIEGLNIVDVAADAGMSHATLIHHFGNTNDMRRALVHHMTDRLLRDMISVLRSESSFDTRDLMRDLFAALSRGGHAKLLAWLAVGEAGLSSSAAPSAEVADLFSELIPVLAGRLRGAAASERTARQLVFLVATAAIGYGISGPALSSLLSMDSEDAVAFPEWLGEQIEVLLSAAGSERSS